MSAQRADADTVAGVQTPDDEASSEPDDEHVDTLPDDLNPTSELVGPYLFPNNNRRRVPGYLYLACAAGLFLLWITRHGPDSVLVNGGILFAAIVLALVGAFHLVAGWDLDVDEEMALSAVAASVDVPVGHASAQMGWRGWTSRPTWRILWYSAEDPPQHRGLALIDGHDGHVLSSLVEANPEDWSALDGRLEAD